MTEIAPELAENTDEVEVEAVANAEGAAFNATVKTQEN